MQIFNIIRIDVKFIINVNETGCNYLLKFLSIDLSVFIYLLFLHETLNFIRCRRIEEG